MLSNNNSKYIRSLKNKKFRQKYNNFLVEGDKMAREVLESHHIEVESIFALSNWIETNKNLLKFHKEKLISVKPTELAKMSSLKTPNQVLLVAKQIKWTIQDKQIEKGLSLYLDGIQDPGNLGTILRVADWFGISAVFCSLDVVELYNPKVIQASMGCFLRVPCESIDLTTLRQKYPNLPCYGMVLDGENMFTDTLEPKGIIVIGNEGNGIRPEVMEQLDHRLSIPAHPSSGAESLNAAIATSIACARFRWG